MLRGAGVAVRQRNGRVVGAHDRGTAAVFGDHDQRNGIRHAGNRRRAERKGDGGNGARECDRRRRRLAFHRCHGCSARRDSRTLRVRLRVRW
jgi:hypothetical protein